MSYSSFKTLEEKVDALIQLCAEMEKENQALKKSAHDWDSERQILIERNQVVCTRLEKVLERLKALEQG